MSEKRYIGKEAIALFCYFASSDAPKVIANGQGKIAGNILEKAQKFDIPIHEDPLFNGILSQLNKDEAIPEKLYKAV